MSSRELYAGFGKLEFFGKPVTVAVFFPFRQPMKAPRQPMKAPLSPAGKRKKTCLTRKFALFTTPCVPIPAAAHSCARIFAEGIRHVRFLYENDSFDVCNCDDLVRFRIRPRFGPMGRQFGPGSAARREQQETAHRTLLGSKLPAMSVLGRRSFRPTHLCAYTLQALCAREDQCLGVARYHKAFSGNAMANGRHSQP